MVSVTSKAVLRLREQLVQKCFEADIGFRMLVNASEPSKTTFNIKLDRQRQEDKVTELDGIRVFLDPASAAEFTDYQLDYLEPDGFFLKTTQEAKNAQNQCRGAMPKA